MSLCVSDLDSTKQLLPHYNRSNSSSSAYDTLKHQTIFLLFFYDDDYDFPSFYLFFASGSLSLSMPKEAFNCNEKYREYIRQ